MTRDQALEAVRQANPLPNDATGPDDFMSMTALLDRVDDRSTDMQTQEKIPKSPATPPRRSRPRWLVPALAAGAVVIAAVVLAVVILSGDDEPPVLEDPVPTTVPESATLTPLEVAQILNDVVLTGDWEAERALFAANATITDTYLVEELDPNPANLAVDTPATELASLFLRFPIYEAYDWDGDGTVSLLDSIASETMGHYAAGVLTRYSCVDNGDGSMTCEQLLEGDPFLIDSCEDQPLAGQLSGFTNTYAVVDGVVTHFSIDSAPCFEHSDTGLRAYHNWMRENRAELDVDETLFSTWGELLLTPDTVETHRASIAEWVAQS